MNWKNKKILVTGAGGFIGSHLTERLVELGADVSALVRYNSRNDWGMIELFPEETKEKINVITGDIKDSDAMRWAAKDINIIFHLAALIPIPYSYIHPRESIETNTIGTLNVLMAAKENNVERMIHTSTSETYGTAQYIPIDEKHLLQGQSPYSASKIGADKIVESFYLSYGLPVATLRPFNVYGPRQSARAVIPTIITQALTKNEVFLGSKHPTRDLTYVADTVEGFIKLAEADKSVLGEVINVGSNFEISIGDLANKIVSLISKNTDKDIKIKFDEFRVRPDKSEVERLWCDNRKAKKFMNWESKVSLDEGLKKTIDYISKNINKYKPNIYNV
ncbi:NAD dependent epimerase/dehydratase [groundwater metagenome]|uniref:NAD dependent epimerase/dehydratase n=1 Tax=groundwater metagenome TaxID=717931 RepID=A0A098E6T0_9ZZZZ